jgi:hypothetical protein
MEQLTSQKFQVGRTYFGRSIGDSNCIIEIEVLKRTSKTITVNLTGEGVKTFRVSTKYTDGCEMIKPWGSYSMSPIIVADRMRELV